MAATQSARDLTRVEVSVSRLDVHAEESALSRHHASMEALDPQPQGSEVLKVPKSRKRSLAPSEGKVSKKDSHSKVPKLPPIRTEKVLPRAFT